MDDLSTVPTWKNLWNTWHLRGFIVLSLLLQTFLSILAPLRKRTSSIWIITPLWFSYLLADWVANFAIGLITKGQGNPSDLLAGKTDDGTIAAEKDLLAFWAPFLLLHLGGPDTITAFALEDNEFWLRHLLGLVLQFSATIYVFVQSVPKKNKLLAPTILMILNGTIKYTERTIAFYLASEKNFKRSIVADIDPGMNYIRLKEVNHWMKEVTEIEIIQDPGRDASMDIKRDLTEIDVTRNASYFVKMFKGLSVDLVFSWNTRNKSRNYFLNRTAKDAFNVVEVELNLLYEELFTKVPVVYMYSYFGIVTRIFSIVLVGTSILILKVGDKWKFNTNIDASITYGLLYGALAFDIIAMFVLFISSKIIIFLSKLPIPGNNSLWTRILSAILVRNVSGILKNPNIEVPTQVSETQTHVWPLMFLKRRWSESIPTYNLIYYCIHPRLRFMQVIYEKLGLTDFLDGYTYVKAKRFTTKLRDFIFEELKSKSELADDLDSVTDINSSRGDRVVRLEDGWSALLPHTLDGDFGQRILLWHIATDICYSKELSDKLVKSKRQVNTNTDYREIAKLLSDYMMYILIMKPSMMTTVTRITLIQFWDLRADVKRNLENEKAHEVNVVRKPVQSSRDSEVVWKHMNACMKIFSRNEIVTKSLLVYSIILAKEVMKIEEEDNNLNKWLMISKVWVDLLCYGASHSQEKMQTAQVSKGGDLITIVWLLMAHFGLGDQFQIDHNQERARRIVD